MIFVEPNFPEIRTQLLTLIGDFEQTDFTLLSGFDRMTLSLDTNVNNLEQSISKGCFIYRTPEEADGRPLKFSDAVDTKLREILEEAARKIHAAAKRLPAYPMRIMLQRMLQDEILERVVISIDALEIRPYPIANVTHYYRAYRDERARLEGNILYVPGVPNDLPFWQAFHQDIALQFKAGVKNYMRRAEALANASRV